MKIDRHGVTIHPPVVTTLARANQEYSMTAVDNAARTVKITIAKHGHLTSISLLCSGWWPPLSYTIEPMRRSRQNNAHIAL